MDFIKRLIKKQEEQLSGSTGSTDGYGYTQGPRQDEYTGQAPPSTYGGGDISQGYGYSQPLAPPQVPHPWVARWDDRERRYLFVNEQSGERSWEMPGHASTGDYGRDGSAQQYGGGQQYDGGQQYGGGQSCAQQNQYEGEEQSKEGSHGLLYGGLAAAGGLAGESCHPPTPYID